MTPYLDKASRQEEIRTAAISGLAASQDLSTLDTLITLTHRGKSPRVGLTALAGLADLARTANPTDEQRRQIAWPSRPIWMTKVGECGVPAINRSRQLGQSAAVSLPALEAIAAP